MSKSVVKHNYIFLTLCSAAGAALVLLGGMKHGPALSTDSAAYLYAAQSFLEGRGLVYFGYESAFIQWPPLFPALIAAISAFGVKAGYAALYLNSAAFGMLVFFSGIWLKRHIKPDILVYAGVLSVLASSALYQASLYVWSEPLFILLVLLALLKLEDYLVSGSRSALLLCGLFTAGACLARYSGVAPAVAIVLIILLNRKGFLEKVRDILFFGVIAETPLAVWMARNYALSGTLTGARKPSSYTAYENAVSIFKTAAAWFLPVGPASSQRLVNVAFLSFLILLAAYSAMKLIKASAPQGGGLAGAPAAVVFAAVYIAYIEASSTAVAIDRIDSRLLSPVFIPLIFLIISMLGSLAGLFRKGRPAVAVRVFAGAAAMMLLLYPAYAQVKAASGTMKEGGGIFSGREWQSSKTAEFAKQLKGSLIYSNYPEAVYLISGVPARYTPKKEKSLPDYGLERFLKDVGEAGKAYFVWFDKNTGASVYNLEELRQYLTIESVEKLEDGEIYATK